MYTPDGGAPRAFPGLLQGAARRRLPVAGFGIRIGTLVPYMANLERVVDLTDPDTTRALGLNPVDFMCAWKDVKASGGVPPTWLVADWMLAERVNAIRVPSAANPGGVNLVVYRFAGTPGQVVQAIDHDSLLPVDSASWPATRGP